MKTIIKFTSTVLILRYLRDYLSNHRCQEKSLVDVYITSVPSVRIG